MKKKRIRKAGFVLFWMCILILFPYFSLYDFEVHLNQTMEAFSYELLYHSAEQKKSAVDAKINGQFYVLEAAAAYIGRSGSIAGENVQQVLSAMMDSGEFNRTCIADPDGKAVTNDGVQLNIKDRPHFQNALQGKRAISASLASLIDGEKRIYLSVPIYCGTEVAGVLSVGYDRDVISNLLLSDEHNEDEHSFIADRSGNILIKGHKGCPVCSSNNFLEFFSSMEIDPDTIETIQADMENDHAGYVSLASDSIDRLVSYTPLGINDWFLISSLPLSATSGFISEIQRNVWMLTIKLTLLFGVVLIYVAYTSHRQKKVFLLEAKQLQLSEERYRIIADLSGNILWEMDLATGTCTFFGDYAEVFGYEPISTNFPEDAIRARYIHPDDVVSVRRVFSKARDNGIGSQAEIRLYCSDGRYLWCLCQIQPVVDAEGCPYRLIGNIVNIDNQKKQTYSLMKKAQTDSLTGLYNRRAIREQIQSFLEETDGSSLFALFLVDIDYFKQINDTFGHLAGDRSLAALSRRLKALSEEGALLGRIGGDEFIVFLRDIHSPKDAFQVATNIREGCSEGFTVDEKPYPVTVSIGISLCRRSGDTFEELYRQADQALYEAKKAGRNLCRFYTPLEK